MGTRRPLILAMVHDPTATSPRCRLRDEHTQEYGDVITPESAVSDAIRQRTESHLRQLGASVSSKPIFLRVEYAMRATQCIRTGAPVAHHTLPHNRFAYCGNLTLVDTPGFILKARSGEAESMPDDIMRMVKEQIAHPHRLIVFLQQSSVEWCSSMWMSVIQEVDPTFRRTVVVASKFDNRLHEFAERWETDKYLAATGYLPANVKPFFIALPKVSTYKSLCRSKKPCSGNVCTPFFYVFFLGGESIQNTVDIPSEGNRATNASLPTQHTHQCSTLGSL